MPVYPRSEHILSQTDEEDLSRAVERFYGAVDMKEAEAAVMRAKSISAGAARTHEITGHLARLEGNEEKAWRSFYLALASANNSAAGFHFDDLLSVSMTVSQYRETKALLEEIITHHPNALLKKKAAAYVANWKRRLDGDTERAREILALRGVPLRFSIIGTFENEDGQGFTIEYPPEREIDYAKEYKGVQLPARWRLDVPLDYQHRLDFGDLVSPGMNVVAYANTYIHVPQEGTYKLLVTSSDAIKLWVNQIQVLGEQKIESDSVDQFIVPVVLRKGWNSILTKSCNERGSWVMGLAVTDREGELVPGLKSSVGPEELVDGPPPGAGYRFAQDFEQRLRVIGEPLRRKYYAVRYAETVGVQHATQNLADLYRTRAPSGLFSRLASSLVAWDAGQLGYTIDTLDALISENGGRAPMLLVLRAEFYDEQGRIERARGDLQVAIEANPNYRTARNHLAESYSNEGWIEEHFAARTDDVARWPDDTESLWGLATAYTQLGRKRDAESVYQTILDHWKGASDILSEMVKIAEAQSDYSHAIRYQKSLIELFPNTPNYYLKLGDILRRAERYPEATKAYERCMAIDNRWPSPLKRLGALAYERGDLDGAVSFWERGLKLDPDDHSLADRLEYVAPQNDTMIKGFIPTDDDIKHVLAGGSDVRIHPGADLIYLLDHSVEQVELDGSTRQFITQIVKAVNDTGRDKLTKYVLPRGRLRIKEAYAVAPEGNRREASSIRQGTVRFRDLEVGSTIVVQYRLDTFPGGYLSRHLFRRWFFHGLGFQFEDSHYVLLVPLDMQLKEFGRGSWNRSEKVQGDRKILEYRSRNVPPLVAEPFMPPMLDLLDQVVLSSIPDWDTIAGWDTNLLVDAFRSTPEIKQLALDLTRTAKTKKDKLDAIVRFVMREIRYQQDYENNIAGVKPHAAPVVIQRAYGDCKDKSVILMTLAKEVGIQTRFALLRTTGLGDFIKELPALQFNHAIVYVPAQDGIDEPMFVDATPDTLDIKTLRLDSQNTWALVIDPESKEWSFIRVPRTSAYLQYTIRKTKMVPKVDGMSHIEVTFTFQGPAAATVRTILRNPDGAKVFTSNLANSLFPGSRVDDVLFTGEDDIVRPVTMMMAVSSDGLTRKQGKSVVVELPTPDTISKFISLPERKLPLQTSLFLSLSETEDEIRIPEGYKVGFIPDGLKIDNQFFTFERLVTQNKKSISLKMRYVEKRSRITAGEYPAFRDAVTEILDSLGQDIILKPKR